VALPQGVDRRLEPLQRHPLQQFGAEQVRVQLFCGEGRDQGLGHRIRGGGTAELGQQR
jgi:hypothetical protein